MEQTETGFSVVLFDWQGTLFQFHAAWTRHRTSHGTSPIRIDRISDVDGNLAL